jgi:hypothetical protein
MTADCKNCASYKNRECTLFGKPEPRSIAQKSCYRRQYGVLLPMCWMPSDEHWRKLTTYGVPKYAIKRYKDFKKVKEEYNKRFGL